MYRVLQRLVLAAIVSLLLQSGGVTRCLPLSVPPQDSPASPLRLKTQVERELSKGESHSYRVSLGSGQYLRAIVNQIGTLVGVSVYGPKQRRLVEVGCRSDRPTQLSLIEDGPGDYRFEVHSLETAPGGGRYQLEIEEMRPATPQDRKRIAAESLVAEGDRLLVEGKTGSEIAAIKKYETALVHWRTLQDKRNEAYTLKDIGEIYHPLGKPERALQCYRRAMLLGEQIRDVRLQAETLCDLGYVHIQLGQHARALEYCVRALKLSREIGDRHCEAKALNSIGEVHYASSDRPKALEYYEQALSLWTQLRDPRGQAQSLFYSGSIYSDLSDSAKALATYERALGLWRAAKDQRGELLTLTAVGHLYSRLGRKQEALENYGAANRLVQVVADPIEEARILNGVASVYQELGEQRVTLGLYRKALRLFQSAHSVRGEVSSLILISGTHCSMQEYDLALPHLRRALALIKALDDKAMESYALKNIADVYNFLGDKTRALDHYKRALALYQAQGERRGEAYALSGIGSICDDRGEKEEALDYQNRALILNQRSGDRFGEVSTLFKIARVERDLGRLAEARAHVEAATNKIESLRTDVASQELRASFLAAVRQNYELYIDLIMRSHRQRPSEGLDGAALQISERARARSLLELLIESRADIRRGVDPALLEHERTLRHQLTDKTERYSRLLDAAHTTEQTAALTSEIETIKNDYEQVLAQIRTTSPRYAALTQPQPLSLGEIQKLVLDPGTLLLEYALGDERSYLWAVTPDLIASFDLPSRADVEAASRRVYELLTAQNQTVKGETEARRDERLSRAHAEYPKAAAALSRMILGPVASYLGTKRLLIVADGALQYIPFAALPEPNVSWNKDQPSVKDRTTFDHGLQPLAVTHEIVNMPSASVMAVLRRELAERKPAPKNLAVLADPVFSLSDSRLGKIARPGGTSRSASRTTRDFERALSPSGMVRDGAGLQRLAFSRREATAISSLLQAGEALEALDFDADWTTATSPQLGDYRIVHLATHALLDSEHPEFSGIVFSTVTRDGKPQRGFLRLHEVYNLSLPAELVVLSACQTGLGKDVKGEGLVGFTRAFMYAGAARVVASLWKVDDPATAELMKRFYGKMFVDRLQPAAALRDAQVEMWRQKKWESPYYWAGFTIQGEWR